MWAGLPGNDFQLLWIWYFFARVKKNHSAQTGGTKVSYLMETCNDHGFRAIAYSLTIEELRKLTLPVFCTGIFRILLY